jgi:hypothetical protein
LVGAKIWAIPVVSLWRFSAHQSVSPERWRIFSRRMELV